MKRKRAPESGVELNFLFKKINRLRNRIMGVVTSGHDSTKLKFKACRKELKKSLEAGVVVYSFNSNHKEGRDSLSLRPARTKSSRAAKLRQQKKRKS